MSWPRRKLLTLLDVGVIASGTGPGGGDILPILDGLGVWYKADDGASSSFAAHFDNAAAESLQINSNPTLQFGNIEWTIGGWVMVEANTGTAQHIIAKRPSSLVDYQIHWDGAGNMVGLAWNGGVHVSCAFPGHAYGTWYFVIMSWNPVGGYISMQSNNAPILTTGPFGVLVNNSTGNLALGTDPSTNASNLTGRMQDWFMFGRALSVAERAFLWNGGTGRRYEELTASFKTDLRAWWPLDEISGTRRDAHTNANHLADINTVTQAPGWVRHPITTNGPIQFWNDSGPNDFDLGIAAANNAPTWIANERNGKAVARFDGTDDYMQTASILGSYLCGPQAQTVFVVQRQLKEISSTYAWGVTGNTLNAHLSYNTSLVHDTGNEAAGGRLLGTRSEPWKDTWHIAEMVRDGASGSFTIEGNPITSTSLPSTSFNGAASSVLYVATHPSNPTALALQGDIAELIIYARTLTTTERDSVRNYLKAKWGIAQNKVLLNTAATGYVLINSTTNDRVAVTL